MQKLNFNLTHAKKLSFAKFVAYVTKYFYPLTTGQHILMEYENDKPKYTILDAKVIKAVYFNRLSSEISKYYFTEYDKIRTLTCELNRPLLFDDKINTCPEMLHIKKSYDLYSSEIKNRFNLC